MSASTYLRTQKISSLQERSTQCSEIDFLLLESSSVNPKSIKYPTYGIKEKVYARERDRKRTEAWENLTLGDKKNKTDEVDEPLKKFGSFLLKTAVISGAVLGGAAIAVPALGFGAAGVTAGSVAAAYQSAALGGTIASGSLFATLQSVGAAGLAASTKVGIVAGSGLVAAATSGSKKNFDKDKHQKNYKEYREKYKRTFFEDAEKDVYVVRSGYKHVSTQTTPYNVSLQML